MAMRSALAEEEEPETGDLLPERVEPQPGLAGVAAGLVHALPLGALEVGGGGERGKIVAVLQEEEEEEERLGVAVP